MDKEFISSETLDRATVQLNTRIPVRLRKRLDAYLQYLDRPPEKRLRQSEIWPKSNQGIVIEALETFLDEHPLNDRPGPDKDPPKPPPPSIKARPKHEKGNNRFHGDQTGDQT